MSGCGRSQQSAKERKFWCHQELRRNGETEVHHRLQNKDCVLGAKNVFHLPLLVLSGLCFVLFYQVKTNLRKVISKLFQFHAVIASFYFKLYLLYKPNNFFIES